MENFSRDLLALSSFTKAILMAAPGAHQAVETVLYTLTLTRDSILSPRQKRSPETFHGPLLIFCFLNIFLYVVGKLINSD